MGSFEIDSQKAISNGKGQMAKFKWFAICQFLKS
jgi:hypothetical protein